MYSMLNQMRIVEASSFVAGPSCAMHLAQLGATVIRIDPIGGGPDFNRWPLAGNGSLYWEGLQKSKQSIAINLRDPAGRELALELITAPGEQAGMLVTNFPRAGFLAHDRLAALRDDMITLRVQGWADGRSGLDYTVNAVTGYPMNTGPVDTEGPVNHVMPGWDLTTGALGAMHLLAAERYRRDTGQGQEVALPLSSVAFTSLAALGQVGEVDVLNEERARLGNDVYGAFGRNFKSADNKHVMVVAVTAKQWRSLLKALDITAAIIELEKQLGVDLTPDEGLRFKHRALINPIVEKAVALHSASVLNTLFEDNQVCWGPYQSFTETVHHHRELQTEAGLFTELDHPSGTRYRAPGSPAQYSASKRLPAQAAPRLGQDTEAVLADVLGFTQAKIGDLLSREIVASNT